MDLLNKNIKNFIKNVFFFSAPFLMLLVIGSFKYSRSGGDLNRIGKVSVPNDYRNKFKESFNLPIQYNEFSQIKVNQDTLFDIFTIGDSFSNQKNYGYQNYLSAFYNYNLVNFNYKGFPILNYNPLQYLNNMINGHVFDTLKTRYIVLQIVERDVIKYFNKINDSDKLNLSELKTKMDDSTLINLNPHTNISSYIKDIKLFYKYKLGYCFNNRAFTSDVYKMKLTKPLFSVNNNQLLFYARDIETINRNTKENIEQFNFNLNSISKKLNKNNIKLIVLISPDKYDLYSDYIVDSPYPENLYFKYFEEQTKDYYYIDTFNLFKAQLEMGIKDLYFADDTHWSPIASKLIARSINDLIKQIK